jgi:hypothetical protein
MIFSESEGLQGFALRLPGSLQQPPFRSLEICKYLGSYTTILGHQFSKLS